jgi:hypothetical protein
VFRLLFSTSKVGGQEKKNKILAMFRIPNTKLINSKCGQRKNNFSKPLTFDVENKKPKVNKLL